MMMTLTSPVIEPSRIEMRIEIARMTAVGDSPFSMRGLASIDVIGEIDGLVVVRLV